MQQLAYNGLRSNTGKKWVPGSLYKLVHKYGLFFTINFSFTHYYSQRLLPFRYKDSGKKQKVFCHCPYIEKVKTSRNDGLLHINSENVS